MAKNISLLGADYPNVPAVQLPQTGGGTATFYDIEKTEADLSVESGVEKASGLPSKCVKSGNVVTIYFALTMTENKASGARIAVIPDGYRPTYQFRSVTYMTDGYARFEINEFGSITLYSALSSGKSIVGIATYI